MELICSQTELHAALQLVSRAVASRPTHPVLANVLLTADEGTSRVSLTGFDLNLGIQTSLNAKITSSGAITLPAKFFTEIVSKLSSDSPITLKSEDSGEKIFLSSKSGSYQMRGMDSEDFPDLPMIESGTSLKIDPISFLNALRNTIFASSNDESKQILTGVNLIFNGSSMVAAATDGHRLAVIDLNEALNTDINHKEDNADNMEKIQVTLPARSLREVERFLASWKDDKEICLFYDSGQVVFTCSDSDQILTTRTLDGPYPNYLQLIPDSFSKQIEINRQDFILSLERIAVLADQYNNVIKISTNSSENMINISADAQDVGKGSESLPVTYNGEDYQIAFNVKYLLDGLKVMSSDTVLLKANAPTTPVIFSPFDDKNDFVYLVMPVQIRS